METLITAVKPTGTPHLGNYAGAIRPALDLIRETNARAILFVADGHALNSIVDPATLARHSFEIAALYLAAGLDPSTALFFRQSDVPEIFELAVLLGCACPKGLLNRAHAYKAAVAANQEAGRDADDGVNMGLFGYPLLMAADILSFDATLVPVGADQRQHVEITRTLARRMNHVYGPGTTVVPRLRIRPEAAELPGVDGRKMAKSRGNGISVVAPRDALRAAIARFVTDGRRLGEPADPDTVPLFSLARAFATTDQTAEIAAMLRSGRGYGDVKQLVLDAIEDHVAPIRARYDECLANPALVTDALATGAITARREAARVLERVRHAMGASSSRPIATR